MQKILKLLFIISLIWVSGCSDDDGSALYIGIWEGTSVTVTDCSNPTNNNTNRRSCDDTRCYRLELNEDGSFSFQEGLPVRTGTWTTAGSELSLCSEEDGEQVCETYPTTLTSSTLTLSTTNEANSCITTQIFSRAIEADDETTNP